MTELCSLGPENRLRSFVKGFSQLLDTSPGEAETLKQGTDLLAALVQYDDWLPEEFAKADPDRYQQFLLHCDSAERFCVVSFVWAPGQMTPIHDHRVWGLIGMLRGEEIARNYVLNDGVPVPSGAEHRLRPGDTEMISPTIGDIHQVRNGRADQNSISIHVYGADIGAVRRSVFDPACGEKPFISGYSNNVLPNIWGMKR